MNNSNQQLAQLRWLRMAGLEYYYSRQKDSIKLTTQNLTQGATQELTHKLTPKLTISEEAITMSTSPQMKQETQDSFLIDNSSVNIARKLAEKLADSADNISKLKAVVEDFTGCDLKHFATNTVFSDGVATAKILLIGEAPGAQEDATGIPFCGESGKLLDNMLAAIGLFRASNIYITNSIFWRPPANRPPTKEELNICRPFVEKHIALINPVLIILTGSTATSILSKAETISKLRRNFYPYINKYLTSPVQATAIFHPAYLLRQPERKKDSWLDLLTIKQFLHNHNIIL